MQNEILSNNQKISMYDILFMSRHKLSIYSNNELLKEIFEKSNENFETLFPYYGGILNVKYNKGLIQKSLITAAEEVFETVIGNRVPKFCTELILKYVSHTNLKIFVDDGQKFLFNN